MAHFQSFKLTGFCKLITAYSNFKSETNFKTKEFFGNNKINCAI